MIVRGGWDGHQPVEVSLAFKKLLKAEGFEVDIYEDLNVFENLENIMKCSIIIPVYTMSEIKPEYVQNICTAVEQGVGFAGCHGGMCDSFRNSTRWQFLTGSQWVEHQGSPINTYTL